MARIWSTGFELQSVTSEVEWDTTTGSPTINTTTKRSGAAALRCNPTATTAYIKHSVRSDSTVKIFARFYLRIAAAPSGLIPIFQWLDSGLTSAHSIRLNAD